MRPSTIELWGVSSSSIFTAMQPTMVWLASRSMSKLAEAEKRRDREDVPPLAVWDSLRKAS